MKKETSEDTQLIKEMMAEYGKWAEVLGFMAYAIYLEQGRGAFVVDREGIDERKGPASRLAAMMSGKACLSDLNPLNFSEAMPPSNDPNIIRHSLLLFHVGHPPPAADLSDGYLKGHPLQSAR